MANGANKTKLKNAIIFLILVVLTILIGVTLALFSSSKSSNSEIENHYPTVQLFTPVDLEPGEEWDGSIIHNGVVYSPKNNITTVLFLGIDKDEYFEADQLFGNGGRADTIMLFIFDNDEHTIDILEVNRDLWTPVDQYDEGDNYMRTGNMQLCLQHAYSNNLERGSQLMMSNVSSVLGGISIDNYCSLTVIGMLKIVDSIGGLPVSFDEDLTYIHPSFVENTTLVLTPELVNELLRVRDLTDLGSNQQRMSRGTFVMRQAFDTLVGSNPLTLLKCYFAVAGDDFITDLDIFSLFRFRNYHLNNIYSMPGSYVEGGFHDEFFADNEQLQEILIELLYEEEN